MIDKAKCVDINLGSDEVMINHNVVLMKEKELRSRNEFIDENPVVNLPANLDVECNSVTYPSPNPNMVVVVNSTMKESSNVAASSWVEVLTKGLEVSNVSIVSNERSSMEH